MDSLGRSLKAPRPLEGWFRDPWFLGNRLKCSITMEEFWEVCCGWDQGKPGGSDPPEVSPAGVWWLWETPSPWGKSSVDIKPAGDHQTSLQSTRFFGGHVQGARVW